MKQHLPALIRTSLAVVCAYLFVTRYWLNRDCIAEAASSCRLDDGSNVTSGAMLWGLLALIFAVLALRSAGRTRG
ncbi:hypothetical protein [Roseibium litorale]|uniref:Uncharacterized protein n=1 Tax=Roseibium litorale TaxID=2803841 RepID=A0ABR9CKL6_9HYPH|nr:hypothetical protein [Roseibium litorale]MBD8891268.1 hypothetical protein [Roseibium litorale]